MSPQRILILAALLYIGWRLIRNLIQEKIKDEATHQNKQKKKAAETNVQDVLVEDPVCHTLIPKHQAIRLRVDDSTYYFCSDTCCDKFTGHPGGKK